MPKTDRITLLINDHFIQHLVFWTSSFASFPQTNYRKLLIYLTDQNCFDSIVYLNQVKE